MKLIVHIGAHKTATTHMQNRLSAARKALAGQGAAVFCPPQTRADEAHALSALLTFPGRWPEAEAAWRAQIDAEEEARMGRVIISDENLLGSMRPGELFGADGQLYPQAGARLRALFDLLGREPTSLALGVRDPASFLTSAFGMWMMSGQGAVLDEFLRGVSPLDLSWSAFAARLIDETRTPRLSVWRFEDYPRDRDKVLARLLGPDRVAVVRGQPRALTGWSQAAYDSFVEAVLAAETGASLAQMAQEARRAHPRGDGVPGMVVLPEALPAASAAAYAKDFARLCRLPGVRPVV